MYGREGLSPRGSNKHPQSTLNAFAKIDPQSAGLGAKSLVPEASLSFRPSGHYDYGVYTANG